MDVGVRALRLSPTPSNSSPADDYDSRGGGFSGGFGDGCDLAALLGIPASAVRDLAVVTIMVRDVEVELPDEEEEEEEEGVVEGSGEGAGSGSKRKAAEMNGSPATPKR